MLAVVPGHREPVTISDKIAWILIRTARWCMDKVTGLSPDQKTDMTKPMTAVIAEKPLTEAQWVRLLLSLPWHQHMGKYFKGTEERREIYI